MALLFHDCPSAALFTGKESPKWLKSKLFKEFSHELASEVEHWESKLQHQQKLKQATETVQALYMLINSTMEEMKQDNAKSHAAHVQAQSELRAVLAQLKTSNGQPASGTAAHMENDMQGGEHPGPESACDDAATALQTDVRAQLLPAHATLHAAWLHLNRLNNADFRTTQGLSLKEAKKHLSSTGCRVLSAAINYVRTLQEDNIRELDALREALTATFLSTNKQSNSFVTSVMEHCIQARGDVGTIKEAIKVIKPPHHVRPGHPTPSQPTVTAPTHPTRIPSRGSTEFQKMHRRPENIPQLVKGRRGRGAHRKSQVLPPLTTTSNPPSTARRQTAPTRMMPHHQYGVVMCVLKRFIEYRSTYDRGPPSDASWQV